MKDIAVIGCGYWGKNLVRTFAQLDALGMVCDTDIEKFEPFMSLYDVAGEECYGDAIDAKDIKGIVVATPSVSHYVIAKEALIAGKDVFVEKPFTDTLEQALELVELANRNNRILMVGHLFMYHPAIIALKKLIYLGKLGRVYYMYATWVNLGIIRRGESVTRQLLPHPLSVFSYLLGREPTSIDAHGHSYLQAGYPDVAFADFMFGEVLAQAHISWLDPHKQRSITVVGSKKMAVFDDMDDMKLKIYDKGVVENTLKVRAGGVVVPYIDIEEPLSVECHDFVRCMGDRSRPISDGEVGYNVISVLEEVDRSILLKNVEVIE